MADRVPWNTIAVGGELVSEADIRSGPGGWIGYAEVTSDQATITTEADLTGLTVTVDVAADRRIRVTGSASFFTVTNAAAPIGWINEGSNHIGRFALGPSLTVGEFFKGEGSVVLTPSEGEHTYKLRVARLTGTGTVTMQAGATFPAFILVEDLGATT